MRFQGTRSRSYFAPQAVSISSLVPLESPFKKLFNGTKHDIRTSRGAEHGPQLVQIFLQKFQHFLQKSHQFLSKLQAFSAISRKSTWIFEKFRQFYPENHYLVELTTWKQTLKCNEKNHQMQFKSRKVKKPKRETQKNKWANLIGGPLPLKKFSPCERIPHFEPFFL